MVGERYINPNVAYYDGSGVPLAGGKIEFYESGTSTPLDTYSDEDLTIANTNPVILDAEGRAGNIFLQNQDYKVILKDSTDVTVWTADPVRAKQAITLNDLGVRPFSHWGTTTNTAAAYQLSPDPLLEANSDTNIFSMEVHLDSTGAATLAIEDLNNPGSYLTAQALKKYDGQSGKLDIEAGDLQEGQTYIVRDDGTDFVVLNPEIIDSLICNDLTVNNDLEVGGTLTLGGSSVGLIPSGYINGFVPSNNTTDADHDIDISPGVTRDSTDTKDIISSSVIIKQIDANWAEGSDMGGFPSGLSLTADTWYHLFVILKDDGVTVDAGYDTSLTATNLLSDATGYTKYRRVTSVLTDGSSNILPGIWFIFNGGGLKFVFKEQILDVDVTDPGILAVTPTLSTPLGIEVDAILVFSFYNTSSSGATTLTGLLTSLDQTDVAPDFYTYDLQGDDPSSGGNTSATIIKNVKTNTSSQVRYRWRISDSDITVKLASVGWIETR